jgi:hypothetical protein
MERCNNYKEEIIMIGYVLRRSETDYVINCDSQGNGGYNVVPKDIDPTNKYTIEEVKSYLAEHPEMLIDIGKINEENAKQREIATLKAYLSSTDYIYPKCLELGLDVNIEYADTVAERIAARARIQELEAPND